jgi:hypothetical protein
MVISGDLEKVTARKQEKTFPAAAEKLFKKFPVLKKSPILLALGALRRIDGPMRAWRNW